MIPSGPLRHRDFLLLWVGQGISRAGTEITYVAVSWQLYLLTRSPVNLGLLGLFRVLPVVVLALGAGVVADALDRRRLMLVTQTTLALSSAALAALTASGRATPALIYALVFLSGCANAFDNPARQALVPALVPADELPRALSLNITTWQLAAVIGPGVGGLILGTGRHGVMLAYLVDTVSYLAVIVSLVMMRPPPAKATIRISFGAALDGLRFIRRQKIILWMMVLDFAATFFAGALQLMPIFADQVLHVGQRGLGVLLAAPSAGALAAAVVMSWLPSVRRRGVVVLAAVLAYGLAIAGFGASRSFVLSLVLLAASGAADTVSMVIRQTIRQLLTPDALRGRMTSVNMVFFMGGPQLGEVEAGVVAKWLGAPGSTVLGGVLCAVFALGVAVAVPTVVRHRAE
jgi:MFS family permease